MFKTKYDYQIGVIYCKSSNEISIFMTELEAAFVNQYTDRIKFKPGLFDLLQGQRKDGFLGEIKRIRNIARNILVIISDELIRSLINDVISKHSFNVVAKYSNELSILVKMMIENNFFVVFHKIDYHELDLPEHINLYNFDDFNFNALINNLISRNLSEAINKIDISLTSKSSPSQTLWEDNINWNVVLTQYFNEIDNYCTLKQNYDWNDLLSLLKGQFVEIFAFLHNINFSVPFCIYPNGHLSLAFYLGYLFGEMSTINPVENKWQNLSFKQRVGIDLTYSNVEIRQNLLIPKFIKVRENDKGSSKDLVLIVNFSKTEKDIVEQVELTCMENNISYRNILMFNVSESGSDNVIIKNTNQLLALGDFFRTNIAKEAKIQANSTIHIFARCTAPFMFILGGLKRYIGTVQLYEYKMYTDNQYFKSFSF